MLNNAGPMRVKEIPVAEITVPEGRLRFEREIPELQESMEKKGLHQPIVVNEAVGGGAPYTLICGLHRLKAARELGWTAIAASLKRVDPLEARLIEIDENLQRYDLTMVERIISVDERDRVLTEMGVMRTVGRPKKGSKEAGREISRTWADFSSDVPTPGMLTGPLPRSVLDGEDGVVPFVGNEEMARQLGMSKSIAKEYRRIARAIPPPLYKSLMELDMGDNLSDLKRLSRMPVKEQVKVVLQCKLGEASSVREALRDQQRARGRYLAQNVSPLGELGDGERYKTLVADPPWDPNDTGDDDPFGKIASDYPTMSLEEIKALPVEDLVDPDDCHLYLWVTGRSMRIGYEVLGAWGFRFAQPLVWVKNRPGTGRYYRNQAEFILFGLRGASHLHSTKFTNVFGGERREHSRKPDEFYDMVRECSPMPALELFQREPHDGFIGWGAEANMNIFDDEKREA